MWGLIASLLEKALGLIAPAVLDRRRVRFTVHRAAFLASGREAVFFNLTNLSKAREIEITHVWIASSPPVAALQTERPLPKRLKPDESWETWIHVDKIPWLPLDSVIGLARARLSTGHQLKAKENRDVPPVGTVPG